MPTTQPHVYPPLRILSSLNPGYVNPKPKLRPRAPTLSSLLCKPHLSMRAALKGKPSMPFGLGKKGRYQKALGLGSTPSSSSLESSRPSSSSVSRSESESGTSSMSEYMHTSVQSVHPATPVPLVVVSRSSILCRVTWPVLIVPSACLTDLDAYMLASRHQNPRAVLARGRAYRGR